MIIKIKIKKLYGKNRKEYTTSKRECVVIGSYEKLWKRDIKTLLPLEALGIYFHQN